MSEANGFTIECGPADARGLRVVTAHCGNLYHRDKIDVDDGFRRAKLRERLIEKFDLSEDAHEHIERRIMEAAVAPCGALFKPVVKLLSTVTPQPLRFLWKPRLVRGKLNLLAGDPGLGKSFVSLDIGARVSTGASFPDGDHEDCSPGGVVILTTEDDPEDTIVPRLIAHNADLNRIAVVEGITDVDSNGQAIHAVDLARDIDSVAAACDQVPDCRLLIIDPISAYLGKSDSFKSPDVTATLAPIRDFARERGIAVLAISHFRKGEGRATQQVMGSMAFVSVSRTAWAITRCPSDPRRRLMTCIKNNLGSDTDGLAYALLPHGPNGEIVVCWEAEPVRMSADQAMSQLRTPTGRKPTARVDAASWLAEYLANGPKSAADVLFDAEADGHKAWTVRRAFTQLECKRRKGGFNEGWIWSLPEDDTEDQSDSTPSENCNLRNLRADPEDHSPKSITNSSLPAKVTEREGSKDLFEDEARCNGHADVPH